MDKFSGLKTAVPRKLEMGNAIIYPSIFDDEILKHPPEEKCEKLKPNRMAIAPKIIQNSTTFPCVFDNETLMNKPVETCENNYEKFTTAKPKIMPMRLRNCIGMTSIFESPEESSDQVKYEHELDTSLEQKMKEVNLNYSSDKLTLRVNIEAELRSATDKSDCSQRKRRVVRFSKFIVEHQIPHKADKEYEYCEDCYE